MSNITEKIKIDAGTFNTVLEMLNSNDEENASTALMAMEQMDKKEGLLYFILLYKGSREKTNLWKEHAPTLLKKIENLGIDPEFSFTSIWEVCKDTAVQDQKEIYKERFEIMLTKILNEWGFKPILNDMEIKIKFKD